MKEFKEMFTHLIETRLTMAGRYLFHPDKEAVILIFPSMMMYEIYVNDEGMITSRYRSDPKYSYIGKDIKAEANEISKIIVEYMKELHNFGVENDLMREN